MTKEELTTVEEKILFHTLGYDYEPRWNDNNGGYRNFFATTDSNDIKIIESLIDKGYMQRNKDVFNEQVFSVKDKGIVYVIDLWGKKKKQNKPTRSKRRYQAYLDWTDCYSGNFKDFLDWLKITERDELFYPKEVAIIRDFKRRWSI